MDEAMFRIITALVNYMSNAGCFYVTILFLSCVFGRGYLFGKRELRFGLGILPFEICASLISGFLYGFIYGFLLALKVATSGADLDKSEAHAYIASQMYENAELYGTANPLFVMSWLQAFALLVLIFCYFFRANKGQKRGVRWLRALEGTFVYELLRTYLRMQVYAVTFLLRGSASAASLDVMWGRGGSILASELIILAVTLFIFLLLYIRLYRRRISIRLKRRYVLITLLWLLLFMFFAEYPVADGLTQEEGYRHMQIIMSLFLLPIAGISLPVILTINVLREQLIEKTISQATYLDAELLYIEQYKRSEQKTRAFRHDIINQLSLADMLLRAGKTQEAQEHLAQLLGNVRALSPQYVTGDEMLDCIVSMKAARMTELGIEFRHDGVVDGGLKLKALDVCSIFANALDNAIEGAQACGGGGLIDLKIKRTNGFFVFQLTNPCKEGIDVSRIYASEEGYTTKEDARHHGFGAQNIKKAAEKYGGMVKAAAEGGRFILTVMIPREDN